MVIFITSVFAGTLLLVATLPSAATAQRSIASHDAIKTSTRALATHLMGFYEGQEPGNTPGLLHASQLCSLTTQRFRLPWWRPRRVVLGVQLVAEDVLAALRRRPGPARRLIRRLQLDTLSRI
ncbi:hypothetical protein C8035_v003132 [Colletotrichum spinosum]|uniref:Uncharacterized protein n=1 Tax=Colletotrichum spinosum TaxID=1347390 RepID=A0A4V3HR49_9PEZI|nr:hypothetical protein C8035_v003132 [Colletotrichum spinosum]